MQGYNALVFAYGPKLSGKTYTMFGPVTATEDFPDKQGIIHRMVADVF